jgi:hypothetical protein
MVSHKNQKISEQNAMSGEGERLTLKPTPEKDGTGSAGIDILGAPPPSRTFIADGFKLIETAELVRLCFIQSQIDGKTPRALLDIHISVAALDQFGANLVNALPVVSSKNIEQFDIQSEPDQTLAVSGNFFRASMSALGSCIDVYYSSAFALRMVTSDKAMYLLPVVRVQMTESLFVAVIRLLESRRSISNPSLVHTLPSVKS